MPTVEGDYNGHSSSRNQFAFWMLGLCNNFAYVIMLSAAEDILSVEDDPKTSSKRIDDPCQSSVVHRQCQPLSTGSVLLANIIPSLIVKIFYPFVMHHVPFGLRHLFTVLLQISSFLVVAFSQNIFMGLAGQFLIYSVEEGLGVALASIGAGIGEVTFLSLTTYFPNNVVGAWSSGTGGAGIFGSFAYAMLTDMHMLRLTPQSALLLMLIVPLTFAFVYWKLLLLPGNIHRVSICKPSTYLVTYTTLNRRRNSNISSGDESAQLIDSYDDSNDDPISAIDQQSFRSKLIMAKPLILKYMLPFAVVYFAEYFINQGLLELLVFDCSHSFGIGQHGQYRWYQVLYQLGVFVSRSSVKFIQLQPSSILVIPILQVINAAFLFWDALEQFIPHVIVVFIIVFYEGLLGGAAYVNIFRLLHKSIPIEGREFSLSFVSMSDSFGIVCAGFLAIPAHNFICDMPV
ncbi:Battenin [Dirofilaria immitis]|nr:Battenin [Dirofilaria immitis]